jgi:hypothetical protein
VADTELVQKRNAAGLLSQPPCSTINEYTGAGSVHCSEKKGVAPQSTGDKSMRCKGIVKGNVVLLEEGVHLPDGTRVTVTMEEAEQVEEITAEELAERRALVAKMKAFGEKLAGRQINLGDLVLEGRKELEERA